MTTSTLTPTPTLFQELDYRDCDGVEVSLLWNRVTDTLSVLVFDSRTNESFELAVTPETALDVFKHPFAHAAFRGVRQEPVRTAPVETADETAA